MGSSGTTPKPSDGTDVPLNRDLPHGQYNLGFMYENGRGVRRDRLEAARWYRMAADQGHENARNALDHLR